MNTPRGRGGSSNSKSNAMENAFRLLPESMTLCHRALSFLPASSFSKSKARRLRESIDYAKTNGQWSCRNSKRLDSDADQLRTFHAPPRAPSRAGCSPRLRHQSDAASKTESHNQTIDLETEVE